jgi:hypothetical protein
MLITDRLVWKGDGVKPVLGMKMCIVSRDVVPWSILEERRLCVKLRVWVYFHTTFQKIQKVVTPSTFLMSCISISIVVT